jgi:hypothetical protein
MPAKKEAKKEEPPKPTAPVSADDATPSLI